MTKRRISSKLVNARTLAIYELDQLIQYIRGIDPELKPEEATVLAAIAVRQTLKVYREDPRIGDEFKQAAAEIKHKRCNAQPSMN